MGCKKLHTGFCATLERWKNHKDAILLWQLDVEPLGLKANRIGGLRTRLVSARLGL